jgi:hypothetical protein
MFGDAREADLIRKVYWLGRDIAGGFAGSVKVGFHLLTDLRAYLASDHRSNAWIPEALARLWSPRAATLFSEHHESERVLGCSILLGGVSPHNNGPFPRTVLIKLTAPYFIPKRVGNFGSIQIGSGHAVEEYRTWAEQYFRDPRFAAAFGTWGGAIGSVLAASIGDRIRENPRPGVSPHLHFVCCLRGAKTEGSTERHVLHDMDLAYRMPQVASNYATFCKLAEQRGLSAARAAA